MHRFFTRNLITLSVAIAGLMALSLGLLLTLQSVESRRETRHLQQVNQLGDALLRMSEYQARERGLTAAYLGGAREVDRAELERIRSRVDHHRERSLALIGGLSAVGEDGDTLLEFHRERADETWARYVSARARVDGAAGSEKPPLGPREWFDIASRSIAATAALRDRLLLVTGMPLSIARLNMVHKRSAWEIGEHMGRIRGLLALYAAGDRPLPPAAAQKIQADRLMTQQALAELLWLRQTDLATPRLLAALEALESRVQGEFSRRVDAMLAGGATGRYPVDALAWFREATEAVDMSLEVADIISGITEQRLAEMAEGQLRVVQGFVGFAFVSAFLAFFSLRRVRRHADAFFHQKELAETTLHAIGDAVLTADREGLVEYMNPMAEELTGWPLSEARGRPARDILKLRSTPGAASPDPVEECLHGEQMISLTHGQVLVRRDGTEVEIEESAIPIRARDATVVGAVIVFYDTDSSRQPDRLLAYHATRDALTGLINRREFERRLMVLLRRAREHGEHHVLAYIDLDQFKVINDTCGHGAGDRMLQQVTFLLRKSVRDSDALARLGGDEFALLLQDTTIEQAIPRLEALRNTVRDFSFSVEDRHFSVSLSIGAVPIQPTSASASQLLSEADAACYAAKEKGRNRVQFFHADDVELSRRKGEMEWVTEITDALREDRFELFCQRLDPLQPHGVPRREILLRLRDRGGTLVAPMNFIPAAERYNLMAEVDRRVIASACRLLARYGGDTTVYQINLSGLSLSDPGLADFIRESARENGIVPQRLCFELTETAAVASLDLALELMTELRGEGFAFSLDDFGSGLSSFTYLKKLPVAQIKINGLFVRDMLNDPLDEAMVRSVVDIGHVLGISVCAEFVESREILERLREMGVDHAQGFAVHRPEPLTDLLEA